MERGFHKLTLHLTILDRIHTVEKIVNLLKQHEPVFLTGLFGIGKKRFVKEIFEKEKIWDVNINPTQSFVPKKNNVVMIITDKIPTKGKKIILEDYEKYKDIKSYLFVTDIDKLKGNFFYKTIAGSTIFLPPLNKSETFYYAKRYSKKYNWKVNNKQLNDICKLSGGHCGILKRLLHFINENTTKNIGDYKDALDFQPLQIKLEMLNKQLSSVSEETLGRSFLFDDSDRIRFPILQLFINNQQKQSLSGKENLILNYLIRERGNYVTKLDIHLNSGGNYDDYSLWGIYKVISRLKQKVKNQYTIVNIKGKGYKLLNK